jgi:hypothetical protein
VLVGDDGSIDLTQLTDAGLASTPIKINEPAS